MTTPYEQQAAPMSKDDSYQVNKAYCRTCGWMYVSPKNERGEIAVARGVAHGKTFEHDVHLLQDICDIYIRRVYPRRTLAAERG